MSPPLPPLLELQPRDDASTLRVEDAWKIALQWCKRLRNKVLLERDLNERSGVAKSYKWIHFLVDMKDRGEVSAARAAAVTWFALSCCPGYGGDENPVFWKFVLSEHAPHGGRGSQQGQSISDAYGFFDGEGVDFPRFKLPWCANESNLLLFCGHPRHPVDGEIEVSLKQVTDMLSPWVDPTRTTRRPGVSLDDVQPIPLKAKLAAITKLPSREPILRGLRKLFIDASDSASDGWPSPIFSIQELDIDGGSCTSSSTRMQWFYDQLRSQDVDVPSFKCHDMSKLSRKSLAALVQCVLRVPGSEVRARTTSLRVCENDPRALAAFSSALPMTTSLRSVQVDTSSHRDEDLDKCAIVWLAYALFHPATAASAWKNLSLTVFINHRWWVRVLRAMALGNNVAAMLDGREPESDGYYRARLARKASVYDHPYESRVQKAAAIATSDGGLEVEVCDVASEDPKQWGSWVAVVAPAYGLGWIRSADVTHVVRRPPSMPSLTELRLSCEYQLESDSTNVIEGVLSAIGQRLVHLDLSEYEPGFDIKPALCCCPSLQSLAIKNNGQLWASEDVGSVLPNLRELYLQLNVHDRVGESLVAFDLPRSLDVLRVGAIGAQHIYRRSGDAIRHILTQRSSLRVFHWEDGLAESYCPTSYAATWSETADRLDELELPVCQHVDIRLPVACTAAFLSVLHRRELALDQEVVGMVMGFAGTRATRLLVLEPEADEGYAWAPPDFCGRSCYPAY